MEPHEQTATFRVVGADLRPDRVTALLGIPPSRAHAKGEPVAGRPGRVYPTGVWGLGSSLAGNESLDNHLRGLASTLRGKEREIGQLTERDWVVSLYCGVFLGGDSASIEISAETLAAIADLAVPLELQLYSNEMPTY